MHRNQASALLITLLTVLLITGASATSNSEPTTSWLQVTDNGQAGITINIDFNDNGNNQLDSKPDYSTLIQTESGIEVPVISRLIALPPGHRAEVRIIDRKSVRHTEGDARVNLTGTELNRQEISSLRLDPPLPAMTGSVESIRGVPVTSVSIYPYQYEEHNDAIIENLSFEVEITFVPDNTIPVVRPVRDRPGSDMSRMLDKILLNSPHRDPYQEVQSEHHDRILILHQENEDFGDNARAWVDSLANWKRQMGYQVEILGVNVNVQEGGLTGARIRDSLVVRRYNDVDNPLSYLIIIGADSVQQRLWFPTCNQGELAGDHFYSLMDGGGNAYLSDIAVGRFHCHDFNELRGAILRSILYERQPYVENGTDWFRRAFVHAENIDVNGGGFVPSMIHLGRWEFVKLTRAGYTVDTMWVPGQDFQADETARRFLNEGRSFVSSRGWVTACYDRRGDNLIVAQTGRKNPFMMAITCLSTPTQGGFFRSSTQNAINGSINAISIDDLSHSKANNSFIGGTLRCFVDFGLLNAGLIHLMGKYQLWSDNRYELAEWALPNVCIIRLMGDPTTRLFTTVPIELAGTHPDAITLGTRGLSIYVESDDEVAPDAWVTIWQEDRLHLVCQPGNDGWTRFTFEDGDLDVGELGVTVTRDNSIPYFATIEVSEADQMVDIAGIEFDGDDVFGNGENIATTVTLVNSGNVDLNNITVDVLTDDPLIAFSVDNFRIDALASGAEIEIQFELQIHRASHGGRTVRIQLDVSNGESNWEHAFAFETSGHRLSVSGGAIVAREFQPGQVARFEPTLWNTGDLATPVVSATLVCLDPDYISVPQNTAVYQAIQSGAELAPQNMFQVEADELAIPGNIVHFMLTLDAVAENDAFVDTVYFQEIIGDPSVRDPFGPDGYGYIAFDSGDEGWQKCPVYEWVEINPSKEEDFVGESIPLLDRADSQDTSLTVDLPFRFKFYGEQFSAIAINSNGWIAFGDDKSMFVDARNQQIPGIQGPDAMVAAFWQDMINEDPERRGVYTYHDAEDDRFIIEWSDMKLYNAGADSNLVEFEIILYNPSAYPTATGNGEIKVQYKSVTITPGDNWDNWFTTTGIKNLDGTDGLEYCYWNRYPVVNKRIENEMAILFTTDRVTVYGGLSGRITLHEDENVGLGYVTVQSLRTGASTLTDEDGQFLIAAIPAGQDSIMLSKDGYNSLIVELEIVQDEVTELNASLTHPEIIASQEPVIVSVRQGETSTVNYEIRNNGNGPLEYAFSRRFPDGSSTSFASIGEFDVSALTEDDKSISGCEFIRDQVYLAGGGESRNLNDEYIYVFSKEMQLVRRFRQPTASSRGFKDLAWDGEFLYGGERRAGLDFPMVIIKFDLDGVAQDTFYVPDANITITPWALAWDPENEHLIVTGENEDVFVLDRDGNLVSRHTIRLPGDVLMIRGAAWNSVDVDNMPLYLIDQISINEGGIRLLKASLETGQVKVLAVLRNDVTYPLGLAIGFDWERSVASLGVIVDGRDNNDLFQAFEIGPDTHFLGFEPERGQIAAGASFSPELIFNAQGLLPDTYEFALAVEHNAANEEIIVDFTMTVEPVSVSQEGIGDIPLEFSLNASYPNPFNSTTRIEFSLSESAPTRLSVFDLSGRLVANLVHEDLQPGKYSVNFKPESLASGIYFYRLKSGQNSTVKRMVYMR